MFSQIIMTPGSSPTLQTFIFTSSGSLVLPSGVTAVNIYCQGAGGGGGSGSSTPDVGGGAGGGGGAAGDYQWGSFTVIDGDTLTVTVGTGGTGGIGAFPSDSGNDGNPGIDGGDSRVLNSLASLIIDAQGGKSGDGGGGAFMADGGAGGMVHGVGVVVVLDPVVLVLLVSVD